MKEAMLYEKMDDKGVHCHLCSHHCVIPDGKLGVCHVRQNLDGTLYTLVYGSAISQNVDPIEKKPLHHFYPGSGSFSIATVGCNFQCKWCQNWEIAHMPRERGMMSVPHTSPEELVEKALATHSKSIAYTYTEPTIFFEYAYDTARLAHEAGLANVYVTNGYMTTEMLDAFHPYLDAANVDLKAFRKQTYHRYVGAGFQPVLDSLVKMKELGIWVEVTTLVVPGINDESAELLDAATFIFRELGPDTPWHLSRFFPHYQLPNVPPTPVETLRRAQEIGQEVGLRYVYMGNVREESNTYCYNCNELLIQRRGYWIAANKIVDGKCPNCGVEIAGVWEKN
jgi:pyruvate formate lyase activating enzyme